MQHGGTTGAGGAGQFGAGQYDMTMQYMQQQYNPGQPTGLDFSQPQGQMGQYGQMSMMPMAMPQMQQTPMGAQQPASSFNTTGMMAYQNMQNPYMQMPTQQMMAGDMSGTGYGQVQNIASKNNLMPAMNKFGPPSVPYVFFLSISIFSFASAFMHLL